MDKQKIEKADSLGEKSGWFLFAIILFALMWGIVMALCISFYGTASGILTIAAVVAGVFLLLYVWQAINYFLTPDEPIKTDGETLYFFSARKWCELKFDEIDEVRTNSQMTHSFTTLRSVMDRGVLRIFDKRNNLYRVKFLNHPEEIKFKIKEMLNARLVEENTNTDDSVNTISTD